MKRSLVAMIALIGCGARVAPGKLSLSNANGPSWVARVAPPAEPAYDHYALIVHGTELLATRSPSESPQGTPGTMVHTAACGMRSAGWQLFSPAPPDLNSVYQIGSRLLEIPWGPKARTLSSVSSAWTEVTSVPAVEGFTEYDDARACVLAAAPGPLWSSRDGATFTAIARMTAAELLIGAGVDGCYVRVENATGDRHYDVIDDAGKRRTIALPANIRQYVGQIRQRGRFLTAYVNPPNDLPTALWVSGDRGETWHQSQLDWAMTLLGLRDGLWVSNGKVIMRTTDGVSWTSISTDGVKGDIRTLSSCGGDVLLMTASGTVYAKVDSAADHEVAVH